MQRSHFCFSIWLALRLYTGSAIDLLGPTGNYLGRTFWGSSTGSTFGLDYSSLIIPRLSFRESQKRLRKRAFQPGAALEDSWVANLHPGFETLVEAQLAFWETFLAKPALKLDRPRWGFKSVRLSAQHVRYLKWLYPDCKIVFLVRDPWQAWLSYKGKSWYTVKPTQRVRSSHQFFALWERTARSFLDAEFDSVLIRYEDLTCPFQGVGSLDRLHDFLGINLRTECLGRKCGSTITKTPPSSFDRVSLKILTPSRLKLGYR